MSSNIIIVVIFWCFIIMIIQLYNITNNLDGHKKDKFDNLSILDSGKLQSDKLKNSKCWIDNDNFPEAKIIYDSRTIIIEELKQILNSDEWGIWSSDYNSTPIFTKMTENEIISRIKSNSGKINSKKEPSWRLFGLILNKKILPTAELCPNTIKLLQSNSSRILNAGFSVLEPKCYIGEHKDFNNEFYRLHIPLIIPKINNNEQNSFIKKSESEKLCVLQVENDYRIWKDNEYFIFDDTCLHNAWNNTSEMRIVLIVDLLKKKEN
jgi:hypothetical protein